MLAAPPAAHKPRRTTFRSWVNFFCPQQSDIDTRLYQEIEYCFWMAE
jgi:hypothetical protein